VRDAKRLAGGARCFDLFSLRLHFPPKSRCVRKTMLVVVLCIAFSSLQVCEGDDAHTARWDEAGAASSARKLA
jgi:hypothetical protein